MVFVLEARYIRLTVPRTRLVHRPDLVQVAHNQYRHRVRRTRSSTWSLLRRSQPPGRAHQRGHGQVFQSQSPGRAGTASAATAFSLAMTGQSASRIA